jgi:hypothetical protein
MERIKRMETATMIELVETFGVVGLVVGEALPAHGHVVAVEDGADGAAFDAELVGELVDGRAGLVAGDEPLRLVVVEPESRLLSVDKL